MDRAPSLNFIRFNTSGRYYSLRGTLRGENDSKQSDEFQAVAPRVLKFSVKFIGVEGVNSLMFLSSKRVSFYGGMLKA